MQNDFKKQDLRDTKYTHKAQLIEKQSATWELESYQKLQAWCQKLWQNEKTQGLFIDSLGGVPSRALLELFVMCQAA